MSRLVTYRCTKCKLTTTLRDNPRGLSSLGSCIITKNCTGELVATSTKQGNINPLKPKLSTDLSSWYPRRGFYKHTQIASRRKWSIVHNLDCHPQLTVYDTDGQQLIDYSVEYTSPSTATVIFRNSIAGVVHCISTISQPSVIESSTSDLITNINTFTQLTVDGVITIATLAPINQPITGTVNCYQAITNTKIAQIPVSFVFSPNISTVRAWSDYTYVRFDGRRYNVRQMDVSAELANIQHTGYFNVTLGTQADTVFLLTNPPYTKTSINVTGMLPYTSVEFVQSTDVTRLTSGLLVINPDIIDRTVTGIVKTM